MKRQLFLYCLVGFGLLAAVLNHRTDSSLASLPGANGKIAFDVRGPSTPGRISFLVPRRDASSFNFRLAPEYSYSPAFSPDSKSLAFVGKPGDQVFLAKIGSRRAPNQLTDLEFASAATPTYSPDGNQVYFENVDAFGSRGYIDAVPSTLKSQSLANATQVMGGRFFNIDVSPDGRRLTYQTNGANAGIHVIRSDGTGDRLIVPNGWDPSFSPDGRRLAFGQVDGSSTIKISTVDLQGGDLRSVGAGSVIGGPTFSPDGQLIAFTGSDGTVDTLETVRVDGTRRTLLEKAPPGESIVIGGWGRSAPFRFLSSRNRGRRLVFKTYGPGHLSVDGALLRSTSSKTPNQPGRTIVRVRPGHKLLRVLRKKTRVRVRVKATLRPRGALRTKRNVTFTFRSAHR